MKEHCVVGLFTMSLSIMEYEFGLSYILNFLWDMLKSYWWVGLVDGWLVVVGGVVGPKDF